MTKFAAALDARIAEADRLRDENRRLREAGVRALENWRSWVHDELDGTTVIRFHLAKIEEVEKELRADNA